MQEGETSSCRAAGEREPGPGGMRVQRETNAVSSLLFAQVGISRFIWAGNTALHFNFSRNLPSASAYFSLRIYQVNPLLVGHGTSSALS